MEAAGGGSGVFSVSFLYKAFIIFVYLGLNISLNMMNKWVLSYYGFQFPLLMSILHMVFSFFALGPFMCLRTFREQHLPAIKKQWLGLMGVGVCFAVNIGFNNVSLLTIPLSLNQVIRAAIPVVAAIGAIFIENKTPTKQEFTSLIVLTSGVAIAVYEGSVTHASFLGVMLCLIGTVCNGLFMTVSGRLLSEKVDVLRLTFYTSPISCLALLPFYWHLERASYEDFRATHSNQYWGVLLLGCLNALSYNVVHYLVIKQTSSVTTTVIGEMKIVLILVLSASILGESRIWTLKMLIGCTTAILGFCMYSHCKLQQSNQQWQPVIKGVPDLAPSLSERAPLIAMKPGSAQA